MLKLQYKPIMKYFSSSLKGCKNLTRDWNRNIICVSSWCALSFVGLGTCLVIISPTILDIASYIGVSLAEVAAMLLVRSVGSVIGSVTAGIVFDRLIKYSLWFIIGLISIGALVTCVIPFSTHLAILGTIFFFHGIMLGGLDTGMHAFLMDVWKNKESGPVFQLLHFMFALGAFLAPLIARPFISSNKQNGSSLNTTCQELFTINQTTTNELRITSECLRQTLLDNCSLVLEGSGSIISNSSSTILLPDDCILTISSTSFRYAFWVAAVPMLISLPGLIVYAIKGQCSVVCKVVATQSSQKEEEKESKPLSYPDKMSYKIVLLTLLFFLLLLYVAAEVNYGTYIFAYAVKSDLQFSKEKATVISSLFWGTFAFFRFFSITLSLCQVSPSLMLAGNLTGSLIASLIVVIGSSNEIAMWIGSGLMGISFASIYPTIVNWLIRHGPATGKATSILSAGATIGDMTLPVLVGVLIDKVGPISLCYFTLADVSLCCVIFTALLIIAYKCKVQPSSNYYQLTQEEKCEDEEEGQTELVDFTHSNSSNEIGGCSGDLNKVDSVKEEDKLTLLDHQNVLEEEL